jgi:hypothetical protein
MGKIGMFHAFFEHYDQTYALAEMKGRKTARLLLQGQKATVYEDTFQLKKAYDCWKVLTQYPQIESLAREKTDLLQRIGPYFDPSFL